MKAKNLHSEKGDIVLSVALPMYNSKEISFLALESLCNQKAINFDWELIIYEEKHDSQTPLKEIESYTERLKKVSCKRVVYITANEHVPLIDKWIDICSKTSETSVSYLLQAADCYSYSHRLRNTYETINVSDYAWYDNYKGLFYSFISDSLVQYDMNMLTNLSMGLKTDLMRLVSSKNIAKGIDGYIKKQITDKSNDLLFSYNDDTLYLDGLDTNGYNNISVNRQGFFKEVRPPFVDCHYTIDTTELPKGIKIRIKKMLNK